MDVRITDCTSATLLGTPIGRSRNRHPLVTREVAEQIANSPEHEIVQDDGRIRRWGYSEMLEKYVRVILLPDGETILNAFPDRDYERRHKP